MANETLRIDLTARDSTAAAFNSLQNSLSGVNRSVASAMSAFASFRGAVLGSAAVAGVIKYSDEWTNLSNKLKAAGLSASEVSTAQNELLKISQRSRSDLGGVADLYARLTLASQSFGASQKEVGTVTETISKVFKMSGKTAAEAQSAALQLGQALSSGVLQGDELRSLRESAPELVRAIAREFNLTVGELKDAGARGELEASRVFKAILKIAPQVDQQFASSKQTFADYATAVSNSFFSLVDAYMRATKESDAYIEAAERVRQKQAELAEATGLLARQRDDLEAKSRAAQETSLLGQLGRTQEDVTNLETSLRALVGDFERLGAFNVKKGELQAGLAAINKALNGTADDAVSALVELQRLGEANPSFRNAFESIAVLLTQLAKVREAAGITRQELETLNGVTVVAEYKPPKFMAGADRAADASFVKTQEDIAKRLIDEQLVSSKMTEAEQKLVSKREEIKKRLGDAAGFVGADQLDAAAKKVIANEDALRASSKGAGEDLDKLAEKYKLIADPLLKYNQQLEEAKRLYDLGKLSADEYANAVANIEKSKEKALNGNKDIEDSFKELQQAVEGFGKKSADALAEFVVTGKTNFKELLQSMLKDLISFFAYQALFKPLFGMLGGGGNGGGNFLGNLFGNIFGGGSIGSSFYPEGSIIGPNLPGMATGGGVSANRAYMVGEKGPELFMPGANGSIVPNDALGGGASVVVNNYSGQQADVKETKDDRGRRRIEVTIGEIVGAELRRAGSSANRAARQAFGLQPSLIQR